jgi:hypothetical protein
MKRSRLRIPEKVVRHFTDQKSSGLSIADYCKEHRIRSSTFYGWNKRYKEKPLPENTSLPSPSFIEIPVRNSSHSSSSRIQVIRTEIEFPAESAEHLYEALKTLLTGN